MQLELNMYKSAREDEKAQKMEIMMDSNKERQERQQRALRRDLDTQDEQWKARLAARRKNSSLSRTRNGLNSS